MIVPLKDQSSLLEVVDSIAELKDQWQAIGLALKLDPSVVKEISGPTKNKDCLYKVVERWLHHDNFTPSWHELVNCLLNRLWGDNISIFKRIVNEHAQHSELSK